MGIVAAGSGTPIYQICYHHAVTKEQKKIECIGEKRLIETRAYLLRKGFIVDQEVKLYEF